MPYNCNYYYHQGFRFGSPDDHLDPEDGHFVDIIHSCIEGYGYGSNLGHADFFPNGKN